MDLVSSIRKTGSRGGVNFKWEDVAASNHRENYLGHSLKAPVGRWAKGKDLTWYAKADEDAGSSTETAEEKAARERQEEIRRIKELEEEALARALGLSVAPKNATGANSIGVGQGRGLAGGEPATLKGGDEKREKDRRKSRHHDDSERRHRKRHRSRSRSRDRRRDRSPRGPDEGHAHRSRGDRDDQRRRGGYRGDEDDGERRRRHHRRDRSHSLDRHDSKKGDRERRRPRSRDRQRSRSPQHRRQRSASEGRHRP